MARMVFEMHSNVYVLKNIGCTAPGLHPVPNYEKSTMNSAHMASWERESFTVLTLFHLH